MDVHLINFCDIWNRPSRQDLIFKIPQKSKQTNKSNIDFLLNNHYFKENNDKHTIAQNTDWHALGNHALHADYYRSTKSVGEGVTKIQTSKTQTPNKQRPLDVSKTQTLNSMFSNIIINLP